MTSPTIPVTHCITNQLTEEIIQRALDYKRKEDALHSWEMTIDQFLEDNGGFRLGQSAYCYFSHYHELIVQFATERGRYNIPATSGERYTLLRELAWETLHREMAGRYEEKPIGWDSERVDEIQSHLNRIHLTQWSPRLRVVFKSVLDELYPC
jgi:hypothetical protein